jgi:hypothetical protein
MHRLKARSGFTMRDVSPAFRFAEPFPTVLRVKHGASAAQQFHITTTYQVIHGISKEPIVACGGYPGNKNGLFPISDRGVKSIGECSCDILSWKEYSRQVADALIAAIETVVSVGPPLAPMVRPRSKH